MKKITLLIVLLLSLFMVKAQTQLTTPVPALASLPTNTGFNANWAASIGASSYDVKVYSGGVQVGTTINVTGSTVSQTITGLNKSTAYTFTVTAIGDGATYTSSPESSPSAVVYTLPLTNSIIFAASAMGTDPTFEKGTYNTNTDALLQYQWNTCYSTPTATPVPTDENSTLIYSTYLDNSKGKAIILNNAPSTSPRTTIFSLTSGNTDYLNGNFYMSALINITAASSTATTFLCFDKSPYGNTQRARVYIKSSTGGFVIGTGVSTSPATYSNVLTFGTTYLIILKYNNATSGNESSTLWINPTLGTSESANTAVSTNSIAATSTYIRGLEFSQITGLTGKIAGIRFANNWEDVDIAGLSPVNAPTAVNAAASVTPTGFTASWTLPTTNNATKYSVLLYQGANLISTTSTTDNTASSLPITASLTPGLSYTYSVIARGNGSTLGDASPVTTSAFVSPVPAVTASEVTSTGFYATWTPTTNATSYTVNVYQGSDLFSSTLISDPTTLILPITGLFPGLTYTYTVSTSEGYTSASSVNIVTINPLIQETFENWNDQATAGAYSITKNLYDGVTSGTFTGGSLVVASTASIGSAGTAVGNGLPSVGRIVFSDATAYLQLPTLPTVGQICIKVNVGTELNAFKLQTWNGSVATDIPGSLTLCSKTITKLFSFNYSYSSPTTIRIASNQSGSVNLWDIQVNPYIATPPSKLSVPTVGSASLIAGNYFTANWTEVSNALGYYVMVYNGVNLISTSYSDGQTTNSAVISGLTPSTAYTYKVVARGDGVSGYSSSDPSSASSQFTTDFGTSLTYQYVNSIITASNKTILSSETGLIQVYNIQGMKILEAQAVNKLNTNLASGIYLVKLTTANGQVTNSKVQIK